MRKSLTKKEESALREMKSFDDAFTTRTDGVDDLSDGGVALFKALYTNPNTKKLPPRTYTLDKLMRDWPGKKT